jgi:hypothetical protein
MYVVYVVDLVVLCVSLTITHLRPFKLGCCVNFVGSGRAGVFGLSGGMQLIMGILVLGGSCMRNFHPREIVLLCFHLW